MQKGRNGEIDLLRFIFSVVIVLFHYNDLYDYEVFGLGNVCVEFFFIVTGFLMAKHVKKLAPYKDMTAKEIANETWRFTYNKAKLLFPYFICVFVLQIVVRHIIVQKMSFREIFVGLLHTLPNVSLTFMGLIPECDLQFYVGNTWFISAMLIAVLILYPMLLKSYDFFVKLVFPLLSLFSLGYLYATNGGSILVWKGWTGFCYEGIIRAIAEIALGAVLFCLSELMTRKLSRLITTKNIVIKIVLTLLKVGCFAIVILYSYGLDFGADYSIHAMLICAVGILLSFTGVGFVLPDCKLTRYLGKIAMPIFIFHGFIRWTFSDIYPAPAVTLKMFIFMIVGTVICSVILMYLTDLTVKGLKALGTKIKKHI